MKVSKRAQGLPLALGTFPKWKVFALLNENGEVYSEVWDLLVAPDSLVFGPAGVKGRRGLFT